MIIITEPFVSFVIFVVRIFFVQSLRRHASALSNPK
jgi:hypothetical protein